MDKPKFYTPRAGVHNMTSLMSQSCWCSVGGVKRELKNGADPNAKDDSGFTALIWNCRMGGSDQIRRRKRIFQLLLKSGASLFEVDIKGRTALFHARYFGARAIRRYIESEFKRRKSS